MVEFLRRRGGWLLAGFLGVYLLVCAATGGWWAW